MQDDPKAKTERYLDQLFGAGAGRRHSVFLDHLQNDALRELVHRFHAIEADTTHLSHEENYLLGMTVLCAMRSYDTAAMFAKTLLHLGVKKEKILEAVGRLAMWIGGIPAAEASAHIQRAIRDWEKRGIASMESWFPPDAP
jgi:alkylhydroperoxidase/carboxymuconolactone decarboxylase family protein YurZ